MATIQSPARLVFAAAFAVAMAIAPSVAVFAAPPGRTIADPANANGCAVSQTKGSYALSCAPNRSAAPNYLGAPSEMGLTAINSNR